MRQFKVEFLVSDEAMVPPDEAIAVLLESIPRQLTHDCSRSNDALLPEEISEVKVTLVREE